MTAYFIRTSSISVWLVRSTMPGPPPQERSSGRRTISPEQAWGVPVDRRSDVYSLGATLYELLSGAPPFRGDTPTEVMMQVISRPATPLQRVVRSIPRDLSVICGTCLEKEPERRYDSARALRDDLNRWLTGEPIAARAPGLIYRTYSFLRRHRAVAAAIAAATILTGGIAGYRIMQLQRDRAQREVAAQFEDHVRYIEHLLDHDRALPLHDTRPAVRRASHEISLTCERSSFPRGARLRRRTRASGDGRQRCRAETARSRMERRVSNAGRRVSLRRRADRGVRPDACRCRAHSGQRPSTDANRRE